MRAHGRTYADTGIIHAKYKEGEVDRDEAVGVDPRSVPRLLLVGVLCPRQRAEKGGLFSERLVHAGARRDDRAVLVARHRSRLTG